MTKAPKVFGLVQAKNDWPLLGLAISYVLMHHVDEVYVLNHSSTDGTLEGLTHLRELWNNRIHVFNCYDQHWWQEALTNTLIMAAQEASPGWIYVFDSDEFLLVEGSRSLKEVLNQAGVRHTAVRYEVQNWISTEDFDDTNLDLYRTLRYRSVPNISLKMDVKSRVNEIWNGTLNFYDVPFLSKIIFRSNPASWLAAGAHVLKNPTNIYTLQTDANQIRAAHLPLLTRTKLERKAIQGEKLTQHQFSPIHGWQNQMIYRFSKENRLDEFWKSHSISPHSHTVRRKLPSFVIDESFVQAITPTLNFLESKWDSKILQKPVDVDKSSSQSEDTQIPFRTAARLARNLQLIAISARSQCDALMAERHALIAERDALMAERDALLKSRS